MAIYTKTGDKGTTSLANGERVSKTDVRIEAYGTVDELNSWIGLLDASMPAEPDNGLHRQLRWVQNKLFNLGAALSRAQGEWIGEDDVRQLELWIDAIQAVVPKQNSFLLPAGSEAVCRCHVARTVCRRAERRMIESQAQENYIRFINRLSDFLFLLARHIAFLNNEPESAWRKE